MKLSKTERNKAKKKHSKLDKKFWKIAEDRAELLARIDIETDELKKKALRTQLRKFDENILKASKTVEKSYQYNNIGW